MMVGSGEERINKPAAGCGALDYYCVASLLVQLARRQTCTGLGRQMNASLLRVSDAIRGPEAAKLDVRETPFEDASKRRFDERVEGQRDDA